MRRTTVWVIVAAMLTMMVAPGVGAQDVAAGPAELNEVERVLFGERQEGALLARLEAAEREVYGRPQDGSAFLVRVQRLSNFLAGANGDLGVRMKLAAAEWLIFNMVYDSGSILQRLDRIERAIYGETFDSFGLMGRLNQVHELLWPGGRMYVADVHVPKGTLVKVELLTEINSKTSKVDDPVRWRVVDNVRMDGKVVIATGATGVGHVIAVDGAGRFGSDGRVQVDFGSVQAMDSTPVYMQLDSRASDSNKNVELAAGASIAGAAILGPLGLAAGLFVTGKDNIIPIGSQFFIEVAEEVDVQALSLVPVK